MIQHEGLSPQQYVQQFSSRWYEIHIMPSESEYPYAVINKITNAVEHYAMALPNAVTVLQALTEATSEMHEDHEPGTPFKLVQIEPEERH